MNVTQNHIEQAEKTAQKMELVGMKFDVKKLAESVAIIEWARGNNDFRSQGGKGRSYMNVTATQIYGKSEDEAIQFIVNKVARKKKRAGAQALKDKYGAESARRIIAKHANK